jgi:hypothetical protein
VPMLVQLLLTFSLLLRRLEPNLLIWGEQGGPPLGKVPESQVVAPRPSKLALFFPQAHAPKLGSGRAGSGRAGTGRPRSASFDSVSDFLPLSPSFAGVRTSSGRSSSGRLETGK